MKCSVYAFIGIAVAMVAAASEACAQSGSRNNYVPQAPAASPVQNVPRAQAPVTRHIPPQKYHAGRACRPAVTSSVHSNASCANGSCSRPATSHAVSRPAATSSFRSGASCANGSCSRPAATSSPLSRQVAPIHYSAPHTCQPIYSRPVYSGGLAGGYGGCGN